MKGNTTTFTSKRDLIAWMERELPEDAQYVAPGLLGYTATAASKRYPAPRLQTDLIFAPDVLTEQSPANDVSWLSGPSNQIKGIIPIVVAVPGTFNVGADDCPTCGKDSAEFVDGDCPDCNPSIVKEEG